MNPIKQASATFLKIAESDDPMRDYGFPALGVAAGAAAGEGTTRYLSRGNAKLIKDLEELRKIPNSSGIVGASQGMLRKRLHSVGSDTAAYQTAMRELLEAGDEKALAAKVKSLQPVLRRAMLRGRMALIPAGVAIGGGLGLFEAARSRRNGGFVPHYSPKR